MPPIKSFESHITIEPVFDERFDLFNQLCSAHNFKPAHLLMLKSRQDTAIRSNKDSFCTGHGKDYEEIYARTLRLVEDLRDCGFQVWRYKIEGIVIDQHFPRLQQIENLTGRVTSETRILRG